MKLDPMARYRHDDIVDAVVVGTGAGGAPLLHRLAAAGLRIVALEAGDNHDPASFAADETLAAAIYWPHERLSGGTGRQAFGANNSGIGVGGSTLHWGAFVPRGDARDFRLNTEFGVGRDWPFGLAELLPYYEAVEAFIGVSGPAFYPWDVTRRYPLPQVGRNAPAQAMAQGCAALGIGHADAPVAVVSREFDQGGHLRRACVNCGYCHQGCRIGAKTSMDVTYLPAAVAAGAEIRPGCMAHGIERGTDGRVTGIVYRRDGKDFRQRCATVFLCAGAVETPRLLLHQGLCNSSGQVGRNYMAHVATQVWGSFPDEMRMNKGYPSSLMTEDMVRPENADFAGGYLVQSLGVVPQTWAESVARGRRLWGRDLVDYLHGYNRVAGIGINGECLPSADNMLTLSDEHDDMGLAKPLITLSPGTNETRLRAHAAAFMRSIWEAAGATDIWELDRAAHTIGTCRMGKDPDEAVVDRFGRSFDVPNLWICDNSIFPSALSANPALTIMAASLRTADAFTADCR